MSDQANKEDLAVMTIFALLIAAALGLAVFASSGSMLWQESRRSTFLRCWTGWSIWFFALTVTLVCAGILLLSWYFWSNLRPD
jgi:protein-S-isoprenylcysteine O-methyltransferase Ste14